MEKVKRSQHLTFLDTTPTSETPTWVLLGVGVTDFGYSYNPQVTTEKWIIEDNARNIHESNQKQGSVSQTIYKDDPCFEFINAGRDKLDYTTRILEIDTWDENESGAYSAKMTDGKVVITSYMGENASIEYDLYFEGDLKEGYATIADNKPTFTENA